MEEETKVPAGQLLRELQEELSDLRKLVEERGFRRFIDVLDEQVRIRSGNVLMTPLSDINSILGQEFMKGEVAGLNMAMRFVEARILDVETEVDELAEELKNEA